MLAELLCPLLLAAAPAVAPAGATVTAGSETTGSETAGPEQPAVASETAPERQLANPWAKWLTGAWVTFQIDNSIAGGMTSKQSLTAVGKTTYTIKDESSWEGGSKDKTGSISLARFGYPHALPDGQMVATETLTIAGRKIDCEVWRARFNEDGQSWDTIAWVSPDYAHPLKIKTKSKIGLDLEVKALVDYVTIAKRKFRCMRYEGTVDSDGKRSPVVQWRSEEIPGGLAKSVSTFDTPQGKVTHTMTVKEFRGTKRK